MYEWLMFQHTTNGWSIDEVIKFAAEEIEMLREHVRELQGGEEE